MRTHFFLMLILLIPIVTAGMYRHGGMMVIGTEVRFIDIRYSGFNHEPKYCSAKWICSTDGTDAKKEAKFMYNRHCPTLAEWNTTTAKSCAGTVKSFATYRKYI